MHIDETDTPLDGNDTPPASGASLAEQQQLEGEGTPPSRETSGSIVINTSDHRPVLAGEPEPTAAKFYISETLLKDVRRPGESPGERGGGGGDSGSGGDKPDEQAQKPGERSDVSSPHDTPGQGDTGEEDGRHGRDGGSGGVGNGPDEQARRDAEEAKAAYGEMRDDLQRLREELTGLREQVGGMIARVDAQIAGVDEMLQAGPGQSAGQAFRLVEGQASLADDVDDAEESAEGEGQSFWDRIKRSLRRAGRKLWAMISRLVRVKEWSLTGTVGTGVLGLAEASISVTFG